MRALTQGRPARLRALVLGACALLVPLDLWDRPPDRTFDIQVPAIYDVLRAQPAGIAAEYPLRPIGKVGDYLDLYYQKAHGKPILNGYFSGPDEQRALALAQLDNPSTAGELATIGVRYVLITPFRFAYGALPPGSPTRGFRLLAKDSYGMLYRVTAAPSPFVYGRSGLEPREGPVGSQFRWATASPVELAVIAPCSNCEGRLIFTAASFAQPRVLRVTDEKGNELVRHKIIRTEPAPVSIPLRFDRSIVLKLFLTPGAQSIHDVTGQPDPRSVSILVKDPRFVPNP
jgi:hypothetical protein